MGLFGFGKKEKDKMKDGLEKTRTGFWGNIMNTLTGSPARAAARSTLGAHFFIRTSSLIIYKIIVVTIILHILSYLCKSVITRLIIINPE